MDLVKLDLTGFRRFEKASIDLLGRLVAIVGPNEAGKSSILEALTRLNDDNPLPPKDLSRGTTPSENSFVLTARFALDAADKAALSSIPEAANAARFVVRKRRDGTRRGFVEPAIRRDPSLRNQGARLIKSLRSSRWARKNPEQVSDDFNAAEALLSGDQETFAATDLDVLDRLAAQLRGEPANSNPGRLCETVRKLTEGERRPDPATAASAILLPRLPEFLLFRDDERNLASFYDLSVDAASPPPALRNFAALAGISLSAAVDAVGREDFGDLENLVRLANSNLKNSFSTGWRQSVLDVQLRLDRNEFRPMVQNTSGKFTELGERSDGLRIFVALVSYLAQQSRMVAPVLLVDEAETHLHYDAQADLVRVLNEQDAAAKVIYSTHSAGCLPLDLGTGVRVVRMQAGDRSEVDNSFWSSSPGLTPLVMAMGATALAFTPTRRAVVAEGITEAILLPSLLREVIDPFAIDYQVVPGLANAGQDVLDDIDMEAARTAFLFDGDRSGRERSAAFIKMGVPKDRVVLLGMPKHRDLVLEDLVRPKAFQDAVNAELSTWSKNVRLPMSAVKTRGRIEGMLTWCKKNGATAPDKKRVATQLLLQARSGSLVAPSARSILVELHETLTAILDRPRLGL